MSILSDCRSSYCGRSSVNQLEVLPSTSNGQISCQRHCQRHPECELYAWDEDGAGGQVCKLLLALYVDSRQV